MQFSLLDSVEVSPAELIDPSKWSRKKGGLFRAPKPKKNTAPNRSDIRLVLRQSNRRRPRYSWPEKRISSIPGGIYRLTFSSESALQFATGKNWFLAGWASVKIGGSYVESFKFPLQKTLFYLPRYDGMELWFKPIFWLETVNYSLEEFRGDWNEKTQSSTQIVLDVLNSEGSPLQEIQEQIRDIPDQITDALDSPEWDWRGNLPP